jgi:hypothetical protein
MYKQLIKPIIFVITSMVTILPQVSIAAPKGFQSPSTARRKSKVKSQKSKIIWRKLFSD